MKNRKIQRRSGTGYLQEAATFKNATTVEARLDWCYTREGGASEFAFQVAKEMRAMGKVGNVPGTDAYPDLFKVMSESSNPKVTAKMLFSQDQKYVAYCQKHFGKVNAFIVPGDEAPPPNTDGDGTDAVLPGNGVPGTAGGGGGGGGWLGPGGGGSGGGDLYINPWSPPIGGGYWKYPTPGQTPDAQPVYGEANEHLESAVLVGMRADTASDFMFL